MAKENIYQIECGDDDELFTFVYDFEPYDPGKTYGPPEKCYPPEGGYATIYEIRDSKGVVIPEAEWVARGFDKKTIEKLEEAAYLEHCEDERDRYDAAMEDRSDAARDEAREPMDRD